MRRLMCRFGYTVCVKSSSIIVCAVCTRAQHTRNSASCHAGYRALLVKQRQCFLLDDLKVSTNRIWRCRLRILWQTKARALWL